MRTTTIKTTTLTPQAAEEATATMTPVATVKASQRGKKALKLLGRQSQMSRTSRTTCNAPLSMVATKQQRTMDNPLEFDIGHHRHEHHEQHWQMGSDGRLRGHQGANERDGRQAVSHSTNRRQRMRCSAGCMVLILLIASAVSCCPCNAQETPAGSSSIGTDGSTNHDQHTPLQGFVGHHDDRLAMGGEVDTSSSGSHEAETSASHEHSKQHNKQASMNTPTINASFERHMLDGITAPITPRNNPLLQTFAHNTTDVNGRIDRHSSRRLRFGQEYTYHPRWMSSKLCWYISLEDCVDLEENAKKHAMDLRQMISPHKLEPSTTERELQSDHPRSNNNRKQGWDVPASERMYGSKVVAESEERRKLETADGKGERQGHRRMQLTAMGRLRVLVLLMQWPNHVGDARVLQPPGDYDKIFNAEDVDSDLYPTGSISRFFDVNSYGKTQFEADIVPWQVAEDDEDVYATIGASTQFANSFIPILDRLDGDGIDFGAYDQNGDLVIDAIVVLHSGYAAEEGGFDCYSGALPNRRISSFQTFAQNSLPWRSSEGYQIGSIAVGSAFRQTCESNIARLGTITHEIFHSFGLPDLYDIEGPLNLFGNIGGIDRYGLMANPAGPGDRKSRPGHLSAWSKVELGWVDPIRITEDGTYKAPPVELEDVIYRIDHPDLFDFEYFLLENRQPIPGDFDEFFFEPGGMLIYHIDENNFNFAGDGNSPRGGPFQTDWPGNGRHYPVALMQRDGLYELEQALNGGHNNDFYYLPEHEIGPGNGETVANTATYPNTDGYALGLITVTNIVINNFVEVENSVMCFDVQGLGSPAPSTTPSDQPSVMPSVSPSVVPTAPLSENPSGVPSIVPSQQPSAEPSSTPTNQPSHVPSVAPTDLPSASPSAFPTNQPSHRPSDQPSTSPSDPPSVVPSASPTISPTSGPTNQPSESPSTQPSAMPSHQPTQSPTDQPSDRPSQVPSIAPSMRPSDVPSTAPSTAPTTEAMKGPIFPSFLFPEFSTLAPNATPPPVEMMGMSPSSSKSSKSRAKSKPKSKYDGKKSKSSRSSSSSSNNNDDNASINDSDSDESQSGKGKGKGKGGKLPKTKSGEHISAGKNMKGKGNRQYNTKAATMKTSSIVVVGPTLFGATDPAPVPETSSAADGEHNDDTSSSSSSSSNDNTNSGAAGGNGINFGHALGTFRQRENRFYGGARQWERHMSETNAGASEQQNDRQRRRRRLPTPQQRQGPAEA